MDYREELLRRIMVGLEDEGIENLDTVKNVLIRCIGDYEITERCTDIALLDNSNEKLIKLYLDVKRSEGGSQRTRSNNAYTLRRFNMDIGKPLAEVNVFDIRLWLTNEQKRVSLQTVDNNRSVIKTMFSWLYSEGFIQKNPAENIKSIKHPKPIKKAFSTVEVDALQRACETPIEKAVVYLMLSSGVRCDELCNLKWEDVDFETNDINVIEGKGNKNRVVMIDDVAMKYLREYKPHSKYKSNFIFPTKYGGDIGAISRDSIWIMVKEIAKRADVQNVYPHRFRRTFATMKYKRGMAIHDIQRLLGHANINTTMMYIDNDMDSLRDAFKRSV